MLRVGGQMAMGLRQACCGLALPPCVLTSSFLLLTYQFQRSTIEKSYLRLPKLPIDFRLTKFQRSPLVKIK